MLNEEMSLYLTDNTKGTQVIVYTEVRVSSISILRSIFTTIDLHELGVFL